MQPENTGTLSKIQANEQFDKLFQTEDNTNCFQCGKKSRQWAETRHAVFLCLTCAATFKDVMKVVDVKSTGLDAWTEEEMKVLRVGGNTRFRKFLEQYDLATAEPKIALRSIAANYYRQSLLAEVKGEQMKEAPSVEEGKKPYVADIPITEMTTDQMLEEAKQRISWAGERTKYYGTKAFDTVHHKVTSGELKEDAKKVAEKVSTKAKDLWSFLSTKIDEIKKPKQEKPAPEDNLQL